MKKGGPRLVTRSAEVEARLADGSRQGQVKLVDPGLGFPARAIDLRINEIPPGGHTTRHRETKEHIFYVLRGRGYSLIDDQRIDWEEGDTIFIPSWAWHQYFNPDPERTARYLVATNTPMMRTLGLDKREG